MLLGMYEAETATWLLQRFAPDSVFYDVGANHGYFSIMAARRGCATVAIEPVPELASAVRANARASGLSNVEVVEVALSSEEGSAQLAVEQNSANSHLQEIQLSHADSNVHRVVEVAVTTLDTITPRHSPPTVIKIDVEGAEADVLRGAIETLRQHRPSLLVSTHSVEAGEMCARILADIGYTHSRLPGFEHELIGEFVEPD
jgi:FkbM family methyltransferase